MEVSANQDVATRERLLSLPWRASACIGVGAAAGLLLAWLIRLTQAAELSAGWAFTFPFGVGGGGVGLLASLAIVLTSAKRLRIWFCLLASVVFVAVGWLIFGVAVGSGPRSIDALVVVWATPPSLILGSTLACAFAACSMRVAARSTVVAWTGVFILILASFVV